MSERDDKKTSGERGRILRCDQWEDMIADALDGTLPAADAAVFARHREECPLCAQMFQEAQQGKAWMEYLAVAPEPAGDLLQKILARTSSRPTGVGEPSAVTGVPAAPSVVPTRHSALPFTRLAGRQIARQMVDPRFMMTVAMAFFSIALTLNLTGINLSQIRAADLQPSRMRATLTRQYYTTNEQVTKYYENLRLVYEMEARVRELRRSTESEPAATPASQPVVPPASQQTPRQPARDGSGTPSSTVPKDGLPASEGGRSHLKGEAMPPATMVLARPGPFDGARNEEARVLQVTEAAANANGVREVFRALRSTTEDQAEGSLV